MSTIRLPTRTRRWPLVLIGIAVLMIVLFTALSGSVIDLLWYREINHAGVFWTVLRTKVVLALVFGLVFFAILYTNLLIARRIRPTTRVLSADQEVLERIRDVTDPLLRWAIPLGSALLAFLVALGVTGQWSTFLLWKNSAEVTFGTPEPLFHRDPAFYIFSLPWLRFLQGWLFSTLVGVTILVGIAHVVWGGIRPQAPMFADKVTPAARAHLSVLLGLIMLVKAWGYYLGRFDLLTSPRGVVEGASYTDVHAQLPALNFLTIVAVICAILFFANIRLRNWSLPIIAVVLLALSSVLLGAVYPAFVQQFRVKPNEQQDEHDYIGDNISATNQAFGLSSIQAQQRDVSVGPLDAKQIAENAGTVSNIRVWRPIVLKENLQSVQRFKQYYDFNDVDVDRYQVNGEERVLMVSAREIAQQGLPSASQTWQNVHLAYSHGYAAVAAQVNTATDQGQPDYVLQDLPPRTTDPEALTLTQPRIYFGESDQEPFVVTNTNVNELDFQDTPSAETTYSGTGGIPLSDFLRRAMFAWKFRDYNLLVSGSISSSSRIMIYRDIQTRVRKPVPFLKFDNDPYLAIVDGKPQWIWDAYTSTDEYPYSQAVDLQEAAPGQDSSTVPLSGTVNYLRNSVKAVVDAYNGTITYYAYLSGPNADPIIQVWAKAFPGLFTDIADAPPSLAAHFRYPENLFQVQAFQYANYHVTDATLFYQKRDFWAIPDDPTLSASGVAAESIRPYYQLIRLPGEQTEEFELVVPFVPADRQNMVGWMAASSDGADYGKLTVFRFPEGRTIEGPTQVFARINQDARFSSERTLLGQAGSVVLFGDFLVIPIEDSFLYVQPVYVQAQQTPIPQLHDVIIVNGSGGGVTIADNLQDALRDAVSGQVPSGGGGPSGGGTTQQQIQRLLQQAQTHFENAQAALRSGNLALYQSEIDAAQAAVEQAAKLAGQSTSPTASPSSSPSPPISPTASPTP
jgi:uncharacterized membrane protein (UPF0182 family)